MGGCATKPKDLESEQAAAPVEAPAPADDVPAASAEKAETVPQENKDGDETKKEEPPLVDLSEPAAAPEAPKAEEEAKAATEEAAESKPAVEEDKKEVAETAAAPAEN